MGSGNLKKKKRVGKKDKDFCCMALLLAPMRFAGEGLAG
jgi:hypothetical protein